MNLPLLPFNTHPLFGGTLFFMVGIVCATSATYAPLLCWSLAIAATFIADHTFTDKKYRQYILIMLAFLLAGYARYIHQVHTHTSFYKQYGNISCAIKGTVTDIKQTNHPCMNCCISIDCDTIKKNNDDIWNSCAGTIQIHTKRINTLLVGDYVIIEDLLFKTKDESEFTHYLIKEKIVATTFMPKIACTQITRPERSITRWLFYQRERVFTALQSKIDAHTFTLFSALFLGNRSTNKKEIDTITDQFKLWGASHYLARSGIHMVIFIVIWQTLLRIAPVQFIFKQLILLFIGTLFFILSWPTTSFIRAFSTFIYCNACLFFNVRPHFLHTIVIITLLTLICNPMQLFFLDFQLSFSLTFGIAWLNYLTHASKHIKTIEC